MNDSKALPGRRKRQRKLMDDGGLQRELIYDGKALPPTKKLFTHRPPTKKLFTTDQEALHMKSSSLPTKRIFTRERSSLPTKKVFTFEEPFRFHDFSSENSNKEGVEISHTCVLVVLLYF